MYVLGTRENGLFTMSKTWCVLCRWLSCWASSMLCFVLLQLKMMMTMMMVLYIERSTHVICWYVHLIRVHIAVISPHENRSVLDLHRLSEYGSWTAIRHCYILVSLRYQGHVEMIPSRWSRTRIIQSHASSYTARQQTPKRHACVKTPDSMFCRHTPLVLFGVVRQLHFDSGLLLRCTQTHSHTIEYAHTKQQQTNKQKTRTSAVEWMPFGCEMHCATTSRRDEIVCSAVAILWDKTCRI